MCGWLFSCSALGRFTPRVKLKQRGESFWPRSSPSLDVLRKQDKKRGPKASRPEEFVSLCRCCSSNGSITTPPTGTALGKRHPHRSRDALKQKGLICSFHIWCLRRRRGKGNVEFIHSFVFFLFFFPPPFQLNRQKWLHIYIALATELYAVCGKWISKAWPIVGTLWWLNREIKKIK